MFDNVANTMWIHSKECATNYNINIPCKAYSTENCYIKYDMGTPSYGGLNIDRMIIGIHNANEDNKYFKYTGLYFFGKAFDDMLSIADEIKVTFILRTTDSQYIGSKNDTSKDLFDNNILIKGHTFESYDEMKSTWSKNHKEFKYHLSCPFMHSIYNEVKSTMENYETFCSVTLNKALLEEFRQYNIKGLQVYCHNAFNGLFSLDNTCIIEVSKFKDFNKTNNIISTESTVVKNKKIYDEKFFHIGKLNYHRFFFFGDKFAEMLDIAREIEITFNLLWFMPNEDTTEPFNIDYNNNFLDEGAIKNSVILAGHSFKDIEEIKKCTTKNEFFEGNSKHKKTVYKSFKTALEEGHTSFTFRLTKEDIEQFKQQGVKGFRLGLTNNGIGYWRTSEFCNVVITQYADHYEPLYIETDKSTWINFDEKCFIGKHPDIKDGYFSAYYFFSERLRDAFNGKPIENSVIRVHLRELPESAETYHLYYHDYDSFNEVDDESLSKPKLLCSFKIIDEYNGFYNIILSEDQINKLRESKGLAIYSKDNQAFTLAADYISIFINYEDEYKINYGMKEFYALEYKTFIRENRRLYNKSFICGTSSEGLLFMPFAFMGDNYQTFMNNADIESVDIEISTNPKTVFDDKITSTESVAVEFFCHKLSSNEMNYELYEYTIPLFSVDLNNSSRARVSLSEKQIKILKENFGFGAVIKNNKEDIISIRNIKIIVTYKQ